MGNIGWLLRGQYCLAPLWATLSHGYPLWTPVLFRLEIEIRASYDLFMARFTGEVSPTCIIKLWELRGNNRGNKNEELMG